MNSSSAIKNRLSIVVLLSGNGSNLQAIIDAVQNTNVTSANTKNKTFPQELPVEIRAVISNREYAYGLQRASNAGIPAIVVKDENFASREDYDRKLQSVIDQYQPQLIVLAGFMRILSHEFVMHYLGKMINIHPSLLPKFRGLNTHQRAIDAGEQMHGATVHFVTPELDGGPAILQARVPVLADDSADALARRVLDMEHQIYPLAIRWIAQAKITYINNQVYFDGKPLPEPVQYPLEPNPHSAA